MSMARIAPVSFLILASSAVAEPTRELSIAGPKEVLEGDPESAAVDAQGQITAGLAVQEVASVSDRPIVSLAPGPGGVIFAGTAGGGLVRVEPGGQARVVAPADKLVLGALTTYRDRLVAASNPDGQILEVAPEGKTRTLFDPPAKYVWSLLADGSELYFSTGEPGGVQRLSAQGTATAVFTAEETHIRAMIKHPRRGLVFGGGQKGVVYQQKPGGAFALYDSDMEEVTAFAVDPRSGDLYAALVSETKAGAFDPERSIPGAQGEPAESDSSPIKGSEVVRISESGRVDLLWSSKREGALGLAFDERARRLYIATGTQPKGRGRIYAVELDQRDRLLLYARIQAPLASALLAQPERGLFFVGTAPSGKLLRLGPGTRGESVYQSGEQDLARISNVGRLWAVGDLPKGSSVLLSIRSGNTKEHDATWSSWSNEVPAPDGGQVQVPQGRYVQLRARLVAAPDGKAPVVRSLHASVIRMNVAPSVQEVFALKRGVYMTRMPREEEREKTVTLSRSMIQGLREDGEDEDGRAVRVRQGLRPGMMTIAWRTDDANGDSLLYRVEVRRFDEPAGAFRLLAADLEDAFYSFDSRGYPDGRYVFRVQASDRPSNPPSLALADQQDSEVVLIDNTAPRIKALRAESSAAGRLRVQAEADDEGSSLGTAELSLDGGPWLLLPAEDGLLDAKSEKLSVELVQGKAGTPELKAGRREVLLRVEDEAGNSATAATQVILR